jgi:thiol-disulfide isomerase/thioredoxin
VVGCGVWLLPAPKPLAVEFASYSDAQLAQARAEGRIVVVKYTASWCAACYVVDRTIYARQDVEAMLAAINAQVMKVDLSNSGDYIPLPRTEIYPVEGEPVVLLGEFQLEEFWDVLAEAYGRPLPDLAAPAEAGDAPAE